MNDAKPNKPIIIMSTMPKFELLTRIPPRPNMNMEGKICFNKLKDFYNLFIRNFKF